MESCKYYGVLFLIASAALLAGCVQDGGEESGGTSTTFAAEPEQVTTLLATTSTTTSTRKPTTTTSTTTTTTSTTIAVAAGNVTVVITNRSFMPQNITISVGTIVTWINNDTSDHQVISDLGYAGSKGGYTRQLNDLNSKRIYHGSIYKYRFQRVGVFGYHCNLYPAIRGTVTVVG